MAASAAVSSGNMDVRGSYYSDRVMITHEGVLDPAVLVRTEGFMHKKGGAVNARGGFRNWKKRWFVLAPVDFLGQQGYELQYFDGPHGALKGRVGLSEVEVSRSWICCLIYALSLAAVAVAVAAAACGMRCLGRTCCR